MIDIELLALERGVELPKEWCRVYFRNGDISFIDYQVKHYEEIKRLMLNPNTQPNDAVVLTQWNSDEEATIFMHSIAGITRRNLGDIEKVWIETELWRAHKKELLGFDAEID